MPYQEPAAVIPRLLTSADVAERLQVNIRTAQRIIRSMPHINIGTGKKNEHLRITEEMLESYINERTVIPSRPCIRDKKRGLSPASAPPIPEKSRGSQSDDNKSD